MVHRTVSLSVTPEFVSRRRPSAMKLVQRTSGRLPLFLLLCVVTMTTGARFPPRKTWWTKRVTDELHVAGRLTETQIKYLKEAGFQSVVSLTDGLPRTYLGPGTIDPLPSSTEEAKLARDIGLSFTNIGASSDDWFELEYIQIFSSVFGGLPKPVLFHDWNGGYASSFVGLVYYLNISRYDENNPDGIDSRELFRRSGRLGYPHFRYDRLLQVVTEVNGDNRAPARPEVSAGPTVSVSQWFNTASSW